jgi:release factor glutamine methyltransferase
MPSTTNYIKFPSLDHFNYTEFSSLYEPAEDTYLLCDSLSQDLFNNQQGEESMFSSSSSSSSLSSPPPPSLIVEIGSGSGTVSSHVINLLSEHGDPRPITLCIDISPIACNATLRTATANDKSKSLFAVEAVCSDLLGSLHPRIKGNVDLLIFNPPYVPTPDEEVLSQAKAHSLVQRMSSKSRLGMKSSIKSESSTSSHNSNVQVEENNNEEEREEEDNEEFLIASWAGGDRGRRVLDRALPQIAACLARPLGRAYIVLVDDNDPNQFGEEAALVHGLKMRTVLRTKAKNENLQVVVLTF